MKTLHMYEVKLIDGSKYRGEIAYRDDRKIVMRMPASDSGKMWLFRDGIMSIQDIGWQRTPLAYD